MLALFFGAAPAPAQHVDAPDLQAPSASHTDRATGAAEPGGASHADEPNPFAGGLGNAILTLVILGTVVVILGRKAWPVLLNALDEREHAIRGALEEAKVEREKAEALLAEYQAKIDKSREEATAIVEEGRRDAGAVKQRIQEETRREIDESKERAKREIQLATDAAIKELYDRTAQLSVEVARGIISKELNPADHQQLVSESLERMRSAARN